MSRHLNRKRSNPELAQRSHAWIILRKDPYGPWYSTVMPTTVCDVVSMLWTLKHNDLFKMCDATVNVSLTVHHSNLYNRTWECRKITNCRAQWFLWEQDATVINIKNVCILTIILEWDTTVLLSQTIPHNNYNETPFYVNMTSILVWCRCLHVTSYTT